MEWILIWTVVWGSSIDTGVSRGFYTEKACKLAASTLHKQIKGVASDWPEGSRPRSTLTTTCSPAK